MANNLNINWSELIKKEARGLDDLDLGEVQEISEMMVITEKGLANKKRFYLPKSLVSNYDGHNLVFNINEQDSAQYIR